MPILEQSLITYEPRHEGFQTRSDTNRVVQSKRMTRGLKFRIYKVEVLKVSEQVQFAKYLGITISDDLDWDQHISEISNLRLTRASYESQYTRYLAHSDALKNYFSRGLYLCGIVSFLQLSHLRPLRSLRLKFRFLVLRYVFKHASAQLHVKSLMSHPEWYPFY